MKLKNKTALITGASAGIGLACAEVFAEAGANLVITARRKDKLEEVARIISEKYEVNCLPIQLDVRNQPEVEEKLSVIEQVDILINNAGLARGLTKIQEGLLQDWEEMIDTNVKGLLYVSRIILPKMTARQSGHVINIGSIAGRQVYPKGNVYCGSKHAVKAISEGMAIDLNGTGVRISNIDPGLVETEFSIVRFHGDREKADNVYVGYEPLVGRDIADIALFCATRPGHVMIQDVLVTPTAQASATIVDKSKK